LKAQSIAIKRCDTLKSMLEDVNNGYFVFHELYKNGQDRQLIQIKMLEYQGMSFTGLSLRYKGAIFGDNMQCFYFSEKCSKTVDKVPFTQPLLNLFIEQVEKSLAILSRQGYCHGDIKTKNIMVCTDMFKLIDWGRLKNIQSFDPEYSYGGSTQAGSPFGFYLMQLRYKNPFPLQTTMVYLDNYAYKELKKFPVFKNEVWPHLKGTFIREIEANKDLSTSQLFERMKHTLDNFNLKLTVLHLCLLNRIDFMKYFDYKSYSFLA
jgi:serine/threonine protein kinase